MVFRKHELQQQAGGIMLGGDGGVHVMGEQLREVDVPVETLVGASNGLIHGAGIGAAVSAAITFVETPHEENVGKNIIDKMKSSHLAPIVGAALAFSAISGFIRYSRASKQNEWSRKHYDFLQSKIDVAKENSPQESPKSFAEREDKKKESSAKIEIG
ncbi:MAG: hypothetical protein ABL867_01335 [Rickettsiales bacterium]